MRHGSLFSGIGGFDLAAHWMGWENVFQVEWDTYCQKVLAKNFPNVKRYGDIREFDGTQYRGAVDIISGGFPCQPFSYAGRKKGKDDDRYLWPQMFRIIKEIRPSYIVAENVPGIINWAWGLVLQEMQFDLENEGYEIQPIVLPALSVMADQRRDRIWFVGHMANSGSIRCNWNKKFEEKFEDRREAFSLSNSCIELLRNKQISEFNRKYNGVSSKLDQDRLKGLGNAIVPQVAYEIFKAIENYERQR